jgi:hypothetical protein
MTKESLRALLGICSVALGCTHPPRTGSSPPPVAIPGVPVVHLCRADADGDPGASITDAPEERFQLARLTIEQFGAVNTNNAQAFRVESGPADACTRTFKAHSATCWGEAGNVYCQTEQLTRLFYAAAWMAVGAGVRLLRSVDGTEVTRDSVEPSHNMLSAMDAFELASSSNATEGGLQCIKKTALRAAPSMWFCGWGVSGANTIAQMDLFPAMRDQWARAVPGDPAIGLAWGVYHYVVRCLLAMIVGHELWHADGGHCRVAAPADADSGGLLQRMADLQAGSGSLCQAEVDPQELSADGCGFRTVSAYSTAAENDLQGLATQLGSMDVGPWASAGKLAELGRRIAIDLFGWIVAVGFDWTTHGSEDSHQDKDQAHFTEKTSIYVRSGDPGGYLYPPFRLVLFVRALQRKGERCDGGVCICDDTADLVLAMLHGSRLWCEEAPRATASEARDTIAGALDGLMAPGAMESLRKNQPRGDSDEAFRCGDTGPVFRSTVHVAW